MLRLLGVPQRLQERGAGAGPRRLAQVEVRVQVEDAHARARAHARGAGQARDRGVGGLVSAAEHHGQVVGVQQPADHRAQLGLARLELARGVVVAAVHGHVARVHERARALEIRERGERAAQRLRAVLGAHAAVVPAHALVRGEADERRGPRARRRSTGTGVALRRRGLAAAVGGADDLVPA